MTEENANSCQLKLGAGNTYSCHQCHNVFKLSVAGSSSEGGPASCPRCGSSLVSVLPSWEPLGATLSETTRMWDYGCQQCQHTFRLPIPDSPSKEKEIKCPACGSQQIRRLTVIDGAPLYNG